VSKRQKILAIIVGAIAVIVAVVLFIGNSMASSNDLSTSPQVTESPQSLTDDNARFLESALNSFEKSEQAKALIPGLRNGEWSDTAVLPKGAKLTIEQETFTIDEDGYAQVDATVSGSIDVSFTVGLVSIDGRWLIYATEQKR